MGIFSRIFSKNTESNSLVRKWVVQEIEKVDYANPDAYAIFIGIINAAVKWGKDGIEGQDDRFSQVARQYLGDATIFEIACYTYYRLEDWLAKNQPELKTELALPISTWIVERFSVTFYEDEQRVNQFFEERLNQYKTMTGAGNSIAEIHLELELRIVSTKGDKFGKSNLPKDSRSIAIDSEYIKRSLENYEEEYLPAVIESIQNYCRNNSEKQLSLKEKKNQEQNYEQKDYLYAMALLAQKDWVRACKAFTKVLSADPEHYDALVQRGLIHVKLNQPVDALQDFTAAISVNPSRPAAYLHRGRCYHRNLGRGDESLADYSAAIDLAPNDAAGYLGRGELYDEIAQYDEKQALENNDDVKYAQVSEMFFEAIHDYSQVIALDPQQDCAYANRGIIYARKARTTKNTDFIEKAIADFEKAISLNWENGYLFKQQDEMKELLERANPSAGQTDAKRLVSQES